MATARKSKTSTKPVKKSRGQLSLLATTYGRSYNPYWSSSLFNDVYLTNDVPALFKDIWYPRDEEAGKFYQFTIQFENLCEDVSKLNLNSLNEENTINHFIKPVLSMLGWIDEKKTYKLPYVENESFSIEEGTKTKSYRPDILIFDSNDHVNYFTAREKNKEKLAAATKHVLLPIEAKYWNRIESYRQNEKLDKKRIDPDLKDDTLSNDFEGQTLKYMQILNKEFGILTDGYTWKLFHRELSSDSSNRCFQFNLGHLMKAVRGGLEKHSQQHKEFIENAKYFYFMFGKESHHPKGNNLLKELVVHSEKYASTLEEDLKKRFMQAMSIVCNGFARASGATNSAEDKEMIRNVAESHLFNIFFLKFCETKNILPIKQAPAEYRIISITNIFDKLSNFRPDESDFGLALEELKSAFSDFNYKPDGYELYNRFMDLIDIVEAGSGNRFSAFEIQGFKESIYTSEERKFVRNYKLTNDEMVRSYFELGYKMEEGEYKQIPYNFFTPRQLGSIYESFLEFRLDKAAANMAFIKKQWQPANLESEKIRALDVPKVKKGELFFSPDNSDRKATGSYYTPDYVVRYIVEEALGALVEHKSSKEILSIRLLDPAMGSGHFLCSSMDYLARAYMTKLEAELNDDLNKTLGDAKREILHNCIHGVDINSRAVKLAKMSLWLESADSVSALEDLSDQLFCADSLISSGIGPKKQKFHAIIGNPPYVNELRNNSNVFEKYQEHPLTKDYYEAKMDLFYFFIERGLDLLEPDGILGFIIAQYWLTRSQTKKFHDKISTDGKILLHVNLKDNVVFDEAKGLHSSILFLKNESMDPNYRAPERFAPKNFKSHKALETWLFGGANLIDESLTYNKGESKFLSAPTGKSYESDSFSFIPPEFVQIGIDTHQEYVTKSHIQQCPGLKLGSGIFVVNSKELKSLKLNSKEKQFLRPFYEANQISISKLEADEKWLFYIDSNLNNELVGDKINAPNLKRHFDKYVKVITSDNAPYGLHRARQENWFAKGSKVICPRKTKIPNFMWTTTEAYFNQSVVIIQTGNKTLDQLIALILNSDFAHNRLKEMKTQGEQLQVDKEVLLRFPFPKGLNLEQFDEILFRREFPAVAKQLKTFVGKINFKKMKFGDQKLNGFVKKIYQDLRKQSKNRKVS